MNDGLEELLARGIEALEAGDRAAVDRICAEHPEHADELRRQLGRLGDAGLLAPAESQPIEVEDRIGPYRVLEPLGRGGMGAVFLAEQTEPVERQVALKVIKLGMDSREVLARFERERQALARMSHPNIAMVLDAGLTAAGRPFFVMEYVPGTPITSYCEQHELPTDARLRLLAQVCEAVQHAHHKGVIHRDLKPSNVLVAEHDGTPVAKVIDFGVAKAIDADADDATLHTRVEQIIGTPEYMSPEQATQSDVDSRIDVYALGVLLYELLTGELPFEPRRLRASPDALRRIIGEESPPTPSSRVSTQSRARPTTGSEGAVRTRSGRRLRGDLDWITLKALAKDRDERYPTPHDLAEDLRRHLACEPVVAGPPSGWYRVRKFVRRYRTQVAAAVAVLGALVAGLIVSLWFWSDAQQSAVRAETNFAEALQAVDQMLTQVGDERLADVPRMEQARRALLESALGFYRGFAARRSDDVALRFETARAHARVGRICQLLGDHADADAAYGEALALLASLEPDAAVGFELACIRTDRARSWRLLHRDGAIDELRTGLAGFQALRTAHPETQAYTIRTAVTHNRLGQALSSNDVAAAQNAFTRAVELAGRVADVTGERADRRRAALYRSDLGNFLFVLGALQESYDELVAARTAIDALAAEAPDDLDMQEALATTGQHLAALFFRLDSGDRRLLDNVDVALPIRERQVREFPRVPDYRARVVELLMLRGRGEFFRRRIPAALATCRDAIERSEDLVADFPEIPEYRQLLATAAHLLGERGATSWTMNRDQPVEEFEAALRRALELSRELHENEPGATVPRSIRSSAAGILAQLSFEHGRLEDAVVLSGEELDLARELAEQQPDVPGYQRDLAGALRMRGQILHASDDLDGAERAFRDGIAALERAVAGGGTPEAQRFFRALYPDLTQTLLAAGDFEAAAAAVEAALQQAPDEWMNLEAAATALLRCHELALTSEHEELAADYAARAAEAALRTEAVQADIHEQVAGMLKFHIPRARTALLVARTQFACRRDEMASQSVERALEHAVKAWRGGALAADRFREQYAAADEVLRAAGQDDASVRIASELQQLLGDKR